MIDLAHERAVRAFLARVALEDPERYRVVCEAWEVLPEDTLGEHERREHGGAPDHRPRSSKRVPTIGRGTSPGQRGQGASGPDVDRPKGLAVRTLPAAPRVSPRPT